MSTQTHFRTCPLCEATCGLSIEVNDGEVGRIRGDVDDVFSKGFICPKGSSLKGLHDDPDRLRKPLVRRGDTFEETDWVTAFAYINERLPPILAEHGKDAVAVYNGNPWSHNLGGIVYLPMIYGAIGKNRFAAASIDQRPREIVSSVLYGARTAFPVPDLDRTELLLLIGSDPFESNGSIASAPDWPGRLRDIQKRGGRFIVVDPRRSKTAEAADEHLAIVPGTDAAFMAAIANVCFAEGLVAPGTLGEHIDGLEDVGRALAAFTPEVVAPVCGISADRIRKLAYELSAAKASIHGRLGTCLQEFATLSSWLIDVVSICTGNLDVPGGAMFAEAAAMGANTTGPSRFGRPSDYDTFHSRVRGVPGAFHAAACICDDRGDGNPWRWPDQGADHDRRKPCLIHPGQQPARSSVGVVGLHGLHRPVPQRDHPSCRRDSAATIRTATKPLRHFLLPVHDAQHRQLLARHPPS